MRASSAENTEIATLTVRRGMRRAFDLRRAAARLGLELDDRVESEGAAATAEGGAADLVVDCPPAARDPAAAASQPGVAPLRAHRSHSLLDTLAIHARSRPRRAQGSSEADVQLALYGDPLVRRRERQTDARHLSRPRSQRVGDAGPGGR